MQAFARQRRMTLADVQERANLLLESVQALEMGMQESEQHILQANEDAMDSIQQEFKTITQGLLPGLVSHVLTFALSTLGYQWL